MTRECYGIPAPTKQTQPNPSSRTPPPLLPSKTLTFSAMYTLYILDASRHVTDIPEAGVLGSNLGFAFGMYEPQAYTPLPSMFWYYGNVDG